MARRSAPDQPRARKAIFCKPLCGVRIRMSAHIPWPRGPSPAGPRHVGPTPPTPPTLPTTPNTPQHPQHPHHPNTTHSPSTQSSVPVSPRLVQCTDLFHTLLCVHTHASGVGGDSVTLTAHDVSPSGGRRGAALTRYQAGSCCVPSYECCLFLSSVAQDARLGHRVHM